MEFPTLNKFIGKVELQENYKSWMKYVKETDSFEIRINKHFNLRHRTLHLIHELSHVMNFLQTFEKEDSYLRLGRYLAEKDASVIEYPLLQKISPTLFQDNLGEFLLSTTKVLFQLELYTNPDQDLCKLYAQTFNRCYKQCHQKSNPTYLLDEQMLLYPLQALPHVIAQSEILQQTLE